MKLLIADLNGSPMNGETAVGTVLLEQSKLNSIGVKRIFFTPSGRKRKGDVLEGVYRKISDMNDVFSGFDVVHINSQSFSKRYPIVKHESITCQVHAPTCYKAYNFKEFFLRTLRLKLFLLTLIQLVSSIIGSIGLRLKFRLLGSLRTLSLQK